MMITKLDLGKAQVFTMGFKRSQGGGIHLATERLVNTHSQTGYRLYCVTPHIHVDAAGLEYVGGPVCGSSREPQGRLAAALAPFHECNRIWGRFVDLTVSCSEMFPLRPLCHNDLAWIPFPLCDTPEMLFNQGNLKRLTHQHKMK